MEERFHIPNKGLRKGREVSTGRYNEDIEAEVPRSPPNPFEFLLRGKGAIYDIV